MPFLIINIDDSIDDIIAEDTGGLPELTKPEMEPIINNKYGHAVFDYIDGAIVLNQARYDALLLNTNKGEYINELIDREKILMAKERLALPIQAIKNVKSQVALDALRGG